MVTTFDPPATVANNAVSLPAELIIEVTTSDIMLADAFREDTANCAVAQAVSRCLRDFLTMNFKVEVFSQGNGLDMEAVISDHGNQKELNCYLLPDIADIIEIWDEGGPMMPFTVTALLM